jgi:hypothetical protein
MESCVRGGIVQFLWIGADISEGPATTVFSDNMVSLEYFVLFEVIEGVTIKYLVKKLLTLQTPS